MLRHAPGGQAVQFDDIMDALRALDRQAGAQYRTPPHYRRVLANRVPGIFGRRSPWRRAAPDDENRSSAGE